MCDETHALTGAIQLCFTDIAVERKVTQHHTLNDTNVHLTLAYYACPKTCCIPVGQHAI